jgi:SAM-dependent methyltransferase
VSYVEATTYDAPKALGREKFDLVFTGIGALCWLPSIKQWAETVVALLKPGGRLFIREGHPAMWALDETVQDRLVMGWPYFETADPNIFESQGTYAKPAEGEAEPHVFKHTREIVWNHGIGETVMALLDAGMSVTALVEHKSVPWEALPGQMIERDDEEWELKDRQDRCPLSFTLVAVRVTV